MSVIVLVVLHEPSHELGQYTSDSPYPGTFEAADDIASLRSFKGDATAVALSGLCTKLRSEQEAMDSFVSLTTSSPNEALKFRGLQLAED